MSVLKKIIESRKQSLPSAALFKGLTIEKNNIDFAAALRRKNDRLSLVAELKRKSPSKGDLNPGMTPQQALELYRPYASAISVLTEPLYFGGSIEDLRTLRSLTDIPLLRKDFIIDPLQVKEARLAGANSYLLIVAALSHAQLDELLAAGREWGMAALVEVHTPAELEEALRHEIEILGVNNRNLNDLTIDPSTAPALFQLIPLPLRESLVLVAESGYSKKEDLLLLPPETDAVLVGSSFMESPNPQNLLREMFA